MRVMTWNLWWRHGPWQQRREPIARVLAEVAPDVCGLQEVWGGEREHFAAELADRLGMHWCWVPLRIGQHRQAEHGADMRIGNAILSRWPILEQAELALPVAEGEQPRAAKLARIDAPGGPLPFVTTHLTHRIDASGERVAQVRALAPFIAAGSAGAAYPPVLTGDLNAEPASDEVRLLCGTLTAPVVPGLVLVDAWRSAPADDPGYTWARSNGFTRPHGLVNARIDYVLVGPAQEGRGEVGSVRLAGTERIGEVWPSDHYAVVADLTG